MTEFFDKSKDFVSKQWNKLHKATLGRCEKLDWDMEFDILSKSAFWSCAFRTFLATAAFILLAGKQGNSPLAWGLSYVIVSNLISDNLNSLCKWHAFINGNGKFGKVIYATLVQIAGAMGANCINEALKLGVSFTAVNGHQFADWKTLDFWLSLEVVALALFLIFKQKSDNKDMPAAFWQILLVTIAFTVGGEGFGFFPAHAFAAGGFASWNNVSAWTTVFVQLWAIVFGNFVLDFAWVW